MAQKSKFETKDINLASYLKGVKGYNIASLRQEGNMMIFAFYDENIKQHEQDTLDFYNNKGDFLSYTNAWKDLKNMIHNIKRT